MAKQTSFYIFFLLFFSESFAQTPVKPATVKPVAPPVAAQPKSEVNFKYSKVLKKPLGIELDEKSELGIKFRKDIEKESLDILKNLNICTRTAEQLKIRDFNYSEIKSVFEDLDIPKDKKPTEDMLKLTSPNFLPRYYYLNTAKVFYSRKFLAEARWRRWEITDRGDFSKFDDIKSVIEPEAAKMIAMHIERFNEKFQGATYQFMGKMTWSQMGDKTITNSVMQQIKGKITDPTKLIPFQAWSEKFDKYYLLYLRLKLIDVTYLSCEKDFKVFANDVAQKSLISRPRLLDLIRLVGQLELLDEQRKAAEIAVKKIVCSRPEYSPLENFSMIDFDPFCN